MLFSTVNLSTSTITNVYLKVPSIKRISSIRNLGVWLILSKNKHTAIEMSTSRMTRKEFERIRENSIPQINK